MGEFSKKELDELNRIVFYHNFLFSEYSNTLNEVLTLHQVTAAEIHTLRFICEMEGITSIRLAALTYRSKGAISQTIKRLEQKGLIEKRTQPGNRKNLLLYSTEKGRQLQEAHAAFNRRVTAEIIGQVLETCTLQELEAFYKVAKARTCYYRAQIQKRNDAWDAQDEEKP